MLLMVKASGVKSLMRTPSSQTCSATRNALEEKIKVLTFTPSPAHLVSDRKHGRSSFFIFSTSISLSVSSLAVYLRYGRKTWETWCTIIRGFCHSTIQRNTNTQIQIIWDSHLAFHHPKKIFCLAVVDWRNHDFPLKCLVTQIPGGFQLSNDDFREFFLSFYRFVLILRKAIHFPSKGVSFGSVVKSLRSP